MVTTYVIKVLNHLLVAFLVHCLDEAFPSLYQYGLTFF